MLTGLPDAAATLAAAERAFADGLPFHAHEILEERWRRTSGGEREVWRALAQFAASVTHAARGNRVGAAALDGRAQRTLTSLQPWPEALPWDRATTLRWCEQHRSTS